MFGSGPELLVVLVIVIVIFGAGKLAGVGKALGRSVREFKEEVRPEDEATSKAEEKTEDTESKKSEEE